jgi:hypothetical protein
MSKARGTFLLSFFVVKQNKNNNRVIVFRMRQQPKFIVHKDIQTFSGLHVLGEIM